MGKEKLLTIREAASILGVSEKEVIDLAEEGRIPAYKIGGVYLRFKRQQLQDYRQKFLTHPNLKTEEKYTISEKISDFFYFNDFYILAALIIVLILVIILGR
jgi:excisionase family DNA binding protein